MLDLSGYRVQMLCEDRHHGEFLRGVLVALGVNQWKIEHPYGISEGRGCGEYFVVCHFPLLADMASKNRENVLYVVVVDADMKTVAEEKQRLYSQISRTMQDRLNNFLVIIPKRNIETWMQYCSLLKEGADTGTMNETADYKHCCRGISAVKTGGYLVDFIKDNALTCDNLPALQEACALFMRDNLKS